MSGMPSQKPTENAFITSHDQEVIKKAEKLGIKQVSEGVVAGVSALLLTGSKQYNVPALDILVEVNPTVMDPVYAEVALKRAQQAARHDIDLSELAEEAKEVEVKDRVTCQEGQGLALITTQAQARAMQALRCTPRGTSMQGWQSLVWL